MTTAIYLQCIFAGLIGIAFHVFAIKLPALMKRAKAANVEFHIREYFAEDWVSLCASVLSVIAFVFILPEIANFKPIVMEYVKFFFIAVGFMGSSLLLSLLGNTSKKIMNVIDSKTNELNELKGEDPSVKTKI